MTNKEAVNWLINLTADIGKSENRNLWHYEQALIEIKEMLESSYSEIPNSSELVKESRNIVKDLVEDDTISRKAAIDAIFSEPLYESGMKKRDADAVVPAIYEKIKSLPSEQPETHKKHTETHACDCISRQAAADIIDFECGEWRGLAKTILDKLEALPSAQPEMRHCVNCGRTVNNGGWYKDGGTRCPIEEYYALPKDGYCHLWEERNVTDDDYPERRTDD